MKKVVGYMIAAVVGLMVNMSSSAEAKTVAVLPLINNVADAEELGSIYYDRSLEVMHKHADLEMVDGKVLEDAVRKYTQTGVLPDAVALQNISASANVDLVIVGDVEKLEKKTPITTGDHKVNIIIRGVFASYDRQTGKYTPHKVNVNKQEMAVFNSRWDLKTEEWAKVVTKECNRIIGNKRLNLEGPKLSKLK